MLGPGRARALIWDLGCDSWFVSYQSSHSDRHSQSSITIHSIRNWLFKNSSESMRIKINYTRYTRYTLHITSLHLPQYYIVFIQSHLQPAPEPESLQLRQSLSSFAMQKSKGRTDWSEDCKKCSTFKFNATKNEREWREGTWSVVKFVQCSVTASAKLPEWFWASTSRSQLSKSQLSTQAHKRSSGTREPAQHQLNWVESPNRRNAESQLPPLKWIKLTEWLDWPVGLLGLCDGLSGLSPVGKRHDSD